MKKEKSMKRKNNSLPIVGCYHSDKEEKLHIEGQKQ
jgi:hypothetical protein